jgi:predicted GIY-YIG superfamily endonuclease
VITLKVPKNFRLSESLIKRLEYLSNKTDRTVTNIIETSIEMYLEQEEIKQKLFSNIPNGISGIYKITCLENNKVYIGRSNDIKRRINNHFSGDPAHKKHFIEDLQNFGRNSFMAEVLEICDIETAKIKEVYYIKKYKSYEFEYGYNALYSKFLD